MGIYVGSVSPNKLLAGQSSEITLGGVGFGGSVTIIINGIFIPSFFTAATLVRFVLPYISAGVYDITVLNGDGSTWFARQSLTISTPPVGFPDLAGPQLPLVLPPIIVESDCSAIINPADSIRNADSAADLFYNISTGSITASLNPDSSSVPVEPINAPDVQSLPSSGQNLVTPWGTFTN